MAISDIRFIVSAVDAATKTLDSVRWSLNQIRESSGGFLAAMESNQEWLEWVRNASWVALAGITALWAWAVKQASNLEQLRAIMNVTTNSAEEWKRIFQEVNDLAVKTPFNTDDLARASTTMMGFGVTSKTVMWDMKMLGDIALWNQERLQWLAYAFGQTSAAGRLTGNEMLQYINWGFNPLQIISEKTWESMLSLKEKMEKWAISVDMVREAMQIATSEGGRYYKAMDTQSKTFSGQMSALGENVKITLAAIWWFSDGEVIKGGLLDTLTGYLEAIIPMLDNVKNWATENPKLAGSILIVTWTVAALATWLATLVLVLPSISAWLMIIRNAMAGFSLVSLINPITIAIAAIWALYLAFSTNFLGIRDITMSALESVKSVIASAWAYISWIWNNQSIGLKDSVMLLWTVVKDLWKWWVEAITKVFSDGLTSMRQFWQEYGDDITKVATMLWNAVKWVFSTALEWIKVVFEGYLTMISGSFRVWWGILSGDTTKILEWVKLVFSGIWWVIAWLVKTALYAINDVIRTLFGIDVVATISWAWDSVTTKTQEAWSFVQEIVSSVSDAIKSKIDSVFALFDSLRNKAREVQSFVQSTLESFGGGGGGGVSGARAMGGSVESGKTYLVGERGPELFTPSFSGNITPNRKLWGGGTSVNISFWSVHVHNEADEDRLVSKLTSEINRQMELYQMGIA